MLKNWREHWLMVMGCQCSGDYDYPYDTMAQNQAKTQFWTQETVIRRHWHSVIRTHHNTLLKALSCNWRH